MRIALTALVVTAAWATLAPAQKLDLTLPESLAANAKEKAEINLDAATMASGVGFAESAVPKKMLEKMKAFKEVHIHSYEFDKTGQYSEKDLAPIRKQLGSNSGWTSIVSVKEKDESTEIFVYKQNDKIAGFLLLAAEPKELAIIHVVGEMTMANLQELVKSTIAYDLKSAKPATAQP